MQEKGIGELGIKRVGYQNRQLLLMKIESVRNEVMHY